MERRANNFAAFPPRNRTRPAEKSDYARGHSGGTAIFLQAEEAKAFVKAAEDMRCAAAVLLVLPSRRSAESQTPDQADIPKGSKFTRVSGTAVFDENNKYRRKKQKTARPLGTCRP